MQKIYYLSVEVTTIIITTIIIFIIFCQKK